jgi:hypothetical protein
VEKLKKLWAEAVFSRSVADKNETIDNPWLAVYRVDDVENSVRELHEFVADRHDEHRRKRNLSKFTLQIKEKIEKLFGEVK